MDANFTSATGRSYHLWPHERWFVDRVRRRPGADADAQTKIFRAGPTAVTLRIAGAANSMLIVPFSIVLLAILVIEQHRWSMEVSPPYKQAVLVYAVLVLPFYCLRIRRMVQSRRERRAYLAAAE